MLGAITGDIAGSAFERHPVETKDFPMFGNRARFTDDTVMTIAVADAFLNGGSKDDFVAALHKFGHAHKRAGYGGRFKQWLNDRETEPYGSWGNGGAMRVSPAGWLADSLEQAEAFAQVSAAVTHNHPEGIKGAQAVAGAIYLARNGADKMRIREYVASKYGYDLNRRVEDIRPGYGFDVSSSGSVPEAIVAFLDSTDFEDAIRNAVSLGGDSDTQAAIAGSIAEAFYGIPDEIAAKAWRYLTPDLRDVVERFFAKTGQNIPVMPELPIGVSPVISTSDDTEVVFILDRSGSMGPLVDDTIGGYNSQLAVQQEIPGTARLTTVLFNQEVSVLHDRVEAGQVEALTSADYCAGGNTALLDAIGKTVDRFVSIAKATPKEQRPGKYMFVIITDGMENASREYRLEEIKEMIQRQEDEYGWEFVFLGANIDAVRTGGRMGFKTWKSLNFMPDKRGMDINFDSIGKASRALRETGLIPDEIWDENRADYRARGPRFEQ